MGRKYSTAVADGMELEYIGRDDGHGGDLRATSMRVGKLYKIWAHHSNEWAIVLNEYGAWEMLRQSELAAPSLPTDAGADEYDEIMRDLGHEV